MGRAHGAASAASCSGCRTLNRIWIQPPLSPLSTKKLHAYKAPVLCSLKSPLLTEAPEDPKDLEKTLPSQQGSAP